MSIGPQKSVQSFLPERNQKIWGMGFKGILSILDQGLFSGANFVASILLGRWLSYSDYGAIAIALAVFVFYFQFQKALILDPMSVLGPAKYDNYLGVYLQDQVKLHFAILIPIGLLIAALVGLVILLYKGGLIYRMTAVLGLVAPLMLLPWLLRRAFYILLRPGEAVVGSMVYAISLIVLLAFFQWKHLLTAEGSLLLMGLAALVSSVFMYWRLPKAEGPSIRLSMRQVLAQNWSYGKWLLASAALVALAGQAQAFIAGGLLGLESAGILDATQNFSHPMSLSVAAAGALSLPILSFEYGRGNFSGLRHKAVAITLALTSLALVYEWLLFVFRVPLQHMVYGEKYAAYSDLIPVWGFIPVLLALNSGISYGLQAAQKPQAVLIASALWVLASLILGVVFTNWWGIWGTAFSALIGYVVAVAVFGVLYYLWVARVRVNETPSQA